MDEIIASIRLIIAEDKMVRAASAPRRRGKPRVGRDKPDFGMVHLERMPSPQTDTVPSVARNSVAGHSVAGQSVAGPSVRIPAARAYSASSIDPILDELIEGAHRAAEPPPLPSAAPVPPVDATPDRTPESVLGALAAGLAATSLAEPVTVADAAAMESPGDAAPPLDADLTEHDRSAIETLGEPYGDEMPMGSDALDSHALAPDDDEAAMTSAELDQLHLGQPDDDDGQHSSDAATVQGCDTPAADLHAPAENRQSQAQAAEPGAGVIEAASGPSIAEPPLATQSSQPPAAGGAPLATGALSFEDTIAAMLRPLLREWLDANLPRMVEKALQAELTSLSLTVAPSGARLPAAASD